MAERWTIPLHDFADALKRAFETKDLKLEEHLMRDFAICDDWVLSKRERL